MHEQLIESAEMLATVHSGAHKPATLIEMVADRCSDSTGHIRNPEKRMNVMTALRKRKMPFFHVIETVYGGTFLPQA